MPKHQTQVVKDRDLVVEIDKDLGYCRQRKQEADQKQSRTLESDWQVKVRLTTEQNQVGKLRSGNWEVRVRRAMGSTMIQTHRLGQGGAREADHQLGGDAWGSLTSGYPC